jgi:UDP-N-acetyl-D-galactosamine dehydrogenase
MITFEALKQKQSRIAVVGLGYVGLPLAVGLSRHFDVVGLDASPSRVAELQRGEDRTREVDSEDLRACVMEFSADPVVLEQAGLILVAVPTPIDQAKTPDIRALAAASRTVGQHLQKGAVVVYESTVYPGLTEEICGPILAQESKMACGEDFFLGYSPERMNPGDKEHTVATIVKVVAGQTPEATDLLANVYGSVVEAGVFKARDIRTAEAAKVIENTQRDLNIALMNELAMLFDRLELDTLEVLEAAGTKWNFLPFRPGLVGGHCIGVDPYYLTHKAQSIGFHPQVILAGRHINDSIGPFIANVAVKKAVLQDLPVKGGRMAVLGLTFKENVPDLRNTRVVDIIAELESFGVTVLTHDPLADPEEARGEYGVVLTDLEQINDLEVLILAVPHRIYAELGVENLKQRFRDPSKAVILDVKGLLDRDAARAAGIDLWRL